MSHEMEQTQLRPMRIKKDDVVVVVNGSSKGKQGRVLKVYPKTRQVVVEGINVRKRAYKRGAHPSFPEGGIHEKTMPIDASNVMLIDPVENVPTRVGVRYETDAEGRRKRVRYAKVSGKDLD